MKLVELLVKEIEEWPEGVTYFVQDEDGEVKAGCGSDLRESLALRMWIRGSQVNKFKFYSDTCTDWQTSVVTKDIYTKHKEETQMKRKVRGDFNPEKEYSVDVEYCTVKDKKEVQQAFFDAGILWGCHGAEFLYIGAKQYSNKLAIGGVQQHLLYGSTTRGCNMSAKEFLDLVYEPENQGHPHVELMLQFAEDAKTTDKPWKNFQWRTRAGTGTWLVMQKDMQFESKYEFRRKPKTKLIHGVEVTVFEFTPKVGEEYYTANVGLPELFEEGYRTSENCTFTQRMIERGLIYPYTEEGKQAAILHSKAMLGIAYLSNAHHTHN